MTPPSWVALIHDVLVRTPTSKAAFRRLVTLVMVTAVALSVLLGVVLLCAGTNTGWWGAMAVGSVPAAWAVRRRPS